MKEKTNIQSLSHFCKTNSGNLGKYISKMSKSNIRSDKIFERYQPDTLIIELTSSAIPNTREVRYFKVTVPNNQVHPSMTLKNIFRIKLMSLTFTNFFFFRRLLKFSYYV